MLSAIIKPLDPTTLFLYKSFFAGGAIIAFICGFYNKFGKQIPPSGDAPMIRRV